MFVIEGNPYNADAGVQNKRHAYWFAMVEPNTLHLRRPFGKEIRIRITNITVTMNVVGKQNSKMMPAPFIRMVNIASDVVKLESPARSRWDGAEPFQINGVDVMWTLSGRMLNDDGIVSVFPVKIEIMAITDQQLTLEVDVDGDHQIYQIVNRAPDETQGSTHQHICMQCMAMWAMWHWGAGIAGGLL